MRKAALKRIKITKTGKLLRRKPRQNHFNAKESGSARRRKKRTIRITGVWEKKIRKYLQQG